MNKKVWLFIVLAAFLFAPAAWAAPGTFTSPLESPISSDVTVEPVAYALAVSPPELRQSAPAAFAQPVAQQVAGNLLVNPGFEGTYHLQDDIGELSVADSWRAWYTEEGGRHRPEFKAETLQTGRAHVRTGQSAQKFFTTFASHDGGVYQRVTGVTPGQWYTFSAWVWVWSTDARDNPPTSVKPTGKYSALVGINPWGDERILYRTTVWGKEVLNVYDQWALISVTAQAWSDSIVVAIRGTPEWPVKSNDSYWDDASLVAADMGGTCPEPTPCPVCPPCPTPTPCPECPGGGEPVDYGRIEAIMRQVFREEWPTP